MASVDLPVTDPDKLVKINGYNTVGSGFFKRIRDFSAYFEISAYFLLVFILGNKRTLSNYPNVGVYKYGLYTT